MNVVSINRLPNMLDSLRIGRKHSNGIVRLNKKQRESFKKTQAIWLDMAMRIINSDEQSMPLVLGITSSMVGEGKTTNCVGIGSAISRETDERVLMLECDLLSPSLATHLNLSATPGMSEFIQGKASLEEIVQGTPIPNLDIIVAGAVQDGAVQDGESDGLEQPLLSLLRRRLPGMLSLFKQIYGFIMLDMPPLLNSPYTRDIVKYTDGTFLAVKAGVTSNDSLERASELISEDKLSGVILVGSDSPLPNWMINLLNG
ncbi:MAG: CpsD/CapB family tyrosine-protein kinase [Chloroflexi bacterium]|nr:CpsD/CapB family tyrosine-protein kinase [Chloroflexota bacterium]